MLDGLAAIAGNVDAQADRAQDLDRHLLVDEVVLRQQDARAGSAAGQLGGDSARRHGRRLQRRGLPTPQPCREPEAAAFARLARGAGLAAHQARQTAGDRQAESGSAILARGGVVGLLERLEQPRQLRWRDADPGILDLEAHQESSLDLRAPRAPAGRPGRAR